MSRFSLGVRRCAVEVCVILGTVLALGQDAMGQMTEAWETTFGGTSWNAIQWLQLTADSQSVMVFDKTSTSAASVGKLDAATGNVAWQRTQSTPGEALAGWMDQSGQLYIGGIFTYTTWKYDPEFQTHTATYSGASKQEYTGTIRTDAAGNVYVGGGIGSWSGSGSGVAKWTPGGTKLWEANYAATSGKDGYDLGMALDSAGNVFHGGQDAEGGPSSRGRLLGNDGSDGHLILNRSLPMANSVISAVAADASDKLYTTYSWDVYTSEGAWNYGSMRSGVTKLDEAGNVLWDRQFTQIGVTTPWKDAIALSDDETALYVPYTQYVDGHSHPGVAKLSSSTGDLLWMQTLDDVDWVSGGGGIDVAENSIYLALSHDINNAMVVKMVEVPEPATAGLLALGGVALLARRRR